MPSNAASRYCKKWYGTLHERGLELTDLQSHFGNCPSSNRVPDFMEYFAQRYRFEPLGKAGRILAMATAHHRFNSIHLFPDGNGRVSRLMSHTMAHKAGIGAHGLGPFLSVALDQVRFMSSLFELNTLSRRLRAYVERSETLKREAAALLEEALIRGEVERGEVTRITGLPERSARRILGDVVSAGLLASDTPKGPVSLRFPIDALDVLFPRLFPET